MSAIGVSLYTVRVGKKNSRKHLPIDAFLPNADLFVIVETILKRVTGKSVDIGGSPKQFVIDKLTPKSGNRSIEGLMEVGNYGYGSSLRDIKTGKQNYRRKISDAEMVPLYFRFWLPQARDAGILAIQSFGEIGGKTGLENTLVTQFAKQYPDYSLRFRKLVSEDSLTNALQTGHIAKLRFIRHGVSKDIADAYGGQSRGPKAASVEMVVTFKKEVNAGGQLRNRLVEALQGDRPATGILELDEFDYHEARAIVDIGGRPRTINLSKPNGMTPRIDVSEDVVTDGEGHPTLDSIRNTCIELITGFSDTAKLVSS